MSIQNSTSVAQIRAMDNKTLCAKAWRILTNNRQAGGGSIKGYKLAQRRIRTLGGRFYLALSDYGNEWGLHMPGDPCPEANQRLIVGVSLDHCASKLGGGAYRHQSLPTAPE